MSTKRCGAFITDQQNQKRRCRRKTSLIYCSTHINTNKDINQVLPNLFIGNKKAAMNVEQLRSYRITHVVNCAEELKHITNKYDSSISCLWLSLYDSEMDSVTDHIDKSIRFIELAISNGHTVLVHCAAGVSRSASIIIAYLMYKHRMSFNTAFNHLKTIRPCCRPNLSFQQQLRSYDFSKINN